MSSTVTSLNNKRVHEDEKVNERSAKRQKIDTSEKEVDDYTAPPPGMFEDDKDDNRCSNCGSQSIIPDAKQGCYVCESCGIISEGNFIQVTAPVRVFSDDPQTQNRMHYGEKYNPYMEHNLTERSTLSRDEKEFLWEGTHDIDNALDGLFRSEVNIAVRERAMELFNKSFSMQLKQKEGPGEEENTSDSVQDTTKTPKNKKLKSDKKLKKEKKGKKEKKEIKSSKETKAAKETKRQRFSRRKQFVVTSLCVALTENVKQDHNKIWTPSEVSNLLEGPEISDNSVKRCLKDLGISEDFLFPKTSSSQAVSSSKK